MSDTENLWYFGFRQIVPRPPGSAVACGPYESESIATKERDAAKAFDAAVSIPFTAGSEEEARDKAEKLTGMI